MSNSILRAVIVDDETNARINLKLLLEKYCPSINVIEMAGSADQAALLVQQSKPDVIFLDIAMPQKNGFELLKLLDFIPSVVFVTAYEKFALRALKASAVDFLLKPVDIDELISVERKLQQIHLLSQKYDLQSDYKEVIRNMVQTLSARTALKKLTLNHTGGFDMIDINDIIFLEGENNYTTFYLNKHKKITTSKTLKEYEDILTDSGFVRIHKSNMINLRHLKTLSTKNGPEAIMSNDIILQISRRRAAEIFDKAKTVV